MTSKISIITPCYNEEGNIERCADEVARVMREELPDYDYEHVFCDNASTDRTLDKLRVMAAGDPHIRVIVNSRNVGPFRNMANGLRNVSGDLVVPMVPADIQDPPSVIPEMVERMTPEIEVVYGIRANRRESAHLRLSRAAYYFTLKASGGASPPSHAGEFMLVRRDVVESVIDAGGSYPYIRGLVAQANPKFDTVKYDWGLREVGKSRNSMNDLIDQALNGIITTAKTPIRWSLLAGIALAVLGVGAAVANFAIFLFSDQHVLQGIPTLIVVTLFFGGLQLFFLGLIGEYVVSIHSEVRPKPKMWERERINFVAGTVIAPATEPATGPAYELLGHATR